MSLDMKLAEVSSLVGRLASAWRVEQEAERARREAARAAALKVLRFDSSDDRVRVEERLSGIVGRAGYRVTSTRQDGGCPAIAFTVTHPRWTAAQALSVRFTCDATGDLLLLPPGDAPAEVLPAELTIDLVTEKVADVLLVALRLEAEASAERLAAAA